MKQLHSVLLLLPLLVSNHAALAYCGCDSTCTDEVWNTLATDAAGSYTCGGRITWLQTDRGYSERDACIRVSDEFANGPCGPVCDPNKCNGDNPSPPPPPPPPPTPPTTYNYDPIVKNIKLINNCAEEVTVDGWQAISPGGSFIPTGPMQPTRTTIGDRLDFWYTTAPIATYSFIELNLNVNQRPGYFGPGTRIGHVSHSDYPGWSIPSQLKAMNVDGTPSCDDSGFKTTYLPPKKNDDGSFVCPYEELTKPVQIGLCSSTDFNQINTVLKDNSLAWNGDDDSWSITFENDGPSDGTATQFWCNDACINLNVGALIYCRGDIDLVEIQFCPDSETPSPPTPVTTPSPTAPPTNIITPQPTTLKPTSVSTPRPSTLSPVVTPPVTTYCGCDSCTDEVWKTLATDAAGSYTCGGRITWLQTDRGYSERDACIRVSDEFPNGPCGPVCDPNKCNNVIPSPTPPPSSSPVLTPPTPPNDAQLEITVTANFERHPSCIYEAYPLSVFYPDNTKDDVSAFATTTRTIVGSDIIGMQFGVQTNDWFWRENPNPFTSQWADNAGMQVIIDDVSTCSFTLGQSWHDDRAPDAREVLSLSSTRTSSGCSFVVTKKSEPSLLVTKNCSGPCIESSEDGCGCISDGSSTDCPTESSTNPTPLTSSSPSNSPSSSPTHVPSSSPSLKPITDSPSKQPTSSPVTNTPSKQPTLKPITNSPSRAPSSPPTSPVPPPTTPTSPSSGCGNGQIRVINNCAGSTLKNCKELNTKTIESGTCQDLNGQGQRFWVGSSDSTCYSSGQSLFEFSYPVTFPGQPVSSLAWNGSLLSGYNYPFKVMDGSTTLLDVSGPSCGGVNSGLFPCSKPEGACIEDSPQWRPICAGCSDSCCDTGTFYNYDCNPPLLFDTSDLVLTFCPDDEGVPPSPVPPPPSPPNVFDPPSSTSYCGCDSCTEEVWNTPATDSAGSFTCGSRITWLQTDRGYDEAGACTQVSDEFANGPCGPACDPNKCNTTPPPTPPPVNPPPTPPSTNQKCGGAVDASNDPGQQCQDSLWGPTGDSSMFCFAYGGPADPCHLNNNNDAQNGLFKDPSLCSGDTFYLWDEPDTQGKDYFWAGREWLSYSERFATELQTMRSRGTKVTSPLLTAGSSGVLLNNMRTFMEACGGACYDESDPAYIDIIAINAFCGPWNDQYGGCRAGASFIYDEAVSVSNAFNNIPVYITNWSRLQTSSASEQLDAIDSIDEFFPSASGGVIERVYWFGATDFGGGSGTTSYLTNVLSDGSTLGDAWKAKCDSTNSESGGDHADDSLLGEPDDAKLVWFDEFDGNGSPDSAKWDYDMGNGCPNLCGWGNNELQSYTNEANNVQINNGILRISAKRDASGSFTSTRMVTRGKQAFKYGRVSIRASVAQCQALGTWPALWMLPEDWVYGGWPGSGEIDIMEAVGYETNKFFGSVHTESFNHGIGTEKTGSVIAPKDDWHVFDIDWQEDRIRFAIDGKVYFEFKPGDVSDYKQWPFNQDFHILLNIAIGGNWGAATGIDEEAFDDDGQYMLVDYVRVYSN